VVVSTFASGSSAGGYRTGGVPPGRWDPGLPPVY
jgi:hypothetical protein